MSSGFVTEAEIEEKKLQRQEEWEKVRKPEDPEEAPEEVIDHRSLFDRLEEQRQKKQDEWDEEHKFKNQFRGLDDEEVDFLDKIDDIREEAERVRLQEERRELFEYQQKQDLIKEQELQNRLRQEIKGPDIKRVARQNSGTKSKQQQLLMGVVKRKSNDTAQSNEKRSRTESNSSSEANHTESKNVHTKTSDTNLDEKSADTNVKNVGNTASKPATTAVGGMGLLGQYGSDSDSDDQT